MIIELLITLTVTLITLTSPQATIIDQSVDILIEDSTSIEANLNDADCEHETGEIETVDYYYRSYLNGIIPVLVNIYDGEITYLTEEQASNTDHGAIYDVELKKVYDIEPDMDYIVHALRWTEKRIKDI